MRRRSVLAGITSGVMYMGCGELIQPVQAQSEVVSEITLPEGDARGVDGVEDIGDNDIFATVHETGPSRSGGTAYYINPDGSVNQDVSVDVIDGITLGPNAAYVGGFELYKYPYDGETSSRTMPGARVNSVTLDHWSEDALWVGGANGKLWKVDPDNLEIDQTIDFGDDVYGLEHDGEYLWAVDTAYNSIYQTKPSDEETIASYDFPISQTIYDIAYFDDQVWLLTDDKILETDIDNSIPNEAPSASFSLSANVLNVGETVSLDAANSEDPDGNIVSYEWDLTGNGEVDTTGEVVSHSYSTSGEYDITLTVTDDDGDTAETTNSIVVSESNNTEDSKNKEDSGDTDNTEDEAEPTARMSISPNTPTIGQKVEFIGSASSAQNSSITSYEWDLNGDGDIDRSGEQVTYTYQNTGEFWIMLKITDENGNVGQTQEKLTVSSSGVSSDQGGNDASDTNSSTPGFGIAETLSAVGGMGYLLKRRLIDDE